jgi:hypothetical protein
VGIEISFGPATSTSSPTAPNTERHAAVYHETEIGLAEESMPTAPLNALRQPPVGDVNR